jgi:hypothetical protein
VRPGKLGTDLVEGSGKDSCVDFYFDNFLAGDLPTLSFKRAKACGKQFSFLTFGIGGFALRSFKLAHTLGFVGSVAGVSATGAFEIYSLIVRTTLEVGRASPPPEPFTCFKIVSS